MIIGIFNLAVEIIGDGTLCYKDTVRLSLNTFILCRVPISVTAEDGVIGVELVCENHGYETEIRFIITLEELQDFYDALASVSSTNNLTEFAASMQWTLDTSNRVRRSIQSNNPTRKQHSTMSRANVISNVMDLYKYRTRRQRIIAKRKAFTWLPVLFNNDLVHGSWWFVFGSAYITLASIIPLIDIYVPVFGTQEEELAMFTYVATWFLMVASGFFFILGSLAFLRACEDPHMAPLLHNVPHLHTDELLGAWLFLIAMLPSVPYSVFFLIAYHYELLYLGMLVVAILLCIGSYMFVLACYPHEETAEIHKEGGDELAARSLPYVLWCLGDRDWVRVHLGNDWLLSVWVIYWVTLLACILSFLKFVQDWYIGYAPGLFIWGTGFADAVWFLIGSMYFVAGSYPEEDMETSNSYRDESTMCGIETSNNTAGGNRSSNEKAANIKSSQSSSHKTRLARLRELQADQNRTKV